MKLHEIPEKSKLKVAINGGKEVFITFHHVDGMYSYCTVDGGDPDAIIHLSAVTPLRAVDDYYVIDEEV